MMIKFRTIIFTLTITIGLFGVASCAAAATFGSSFSNRSYSTTGLNSGLIGYWTFDGADGATDKSGQGNNGTLVGGVTKAIGKFGQALKFDGSTGYVSRTGVNLGNSFSFSAWIKLSSLGTTQMILTKGLVSVHWPSYDFYINSSNNLTSWFSTSDTVGGFGTPVSSNFTFSKNIWYFVTATYDGANIKYYINGAFDSQPARTGSPYVNDSPLLTGADKDAGVGLYNQFNGSIDDVRIYNRALSAAEVKQLYATGSSAVMGSSLTAGKSYVTTGLNSGLVGYWTFDGTDMAGTQVYDKSGNNNTGTMNGGIQKITGKLGQGLKFDGSTGYVSMPATINNNITNQISVSAWINSNISSNPDGTGFDGIVSEVYTGDLNVTLELSLGASSLTTPDKVFVGFYDTDWHYISDPQSITAKKWIFYLATYDGHYIRLYRDGVQVAISSDLNRSLPAGTAGWRIGSRHDIQGAGNMWNGKIDDVRIYNRALSAAEIKQLYATGSSAVMGSNLTSAKSYVTTGLKSGLVGYWTFDSPDIAGTQAYDKSNTGNTGTLNGGYVKTIGKLGQAMNFDGSTGYVGITDVLSLRPSTSITIAAWVKMSSSKNMVIFDHESANPWYGYTLFIFSNQVSFDLYTGSGPVTTLTSNSTLSLNKWYYIIATYNGSAYKIFINGAQDNSASKSGTITYTVTQDPDIGRRSVAVNDRLYMQGNLDDVRVWNRALSSAEIQQLYAMGK